MKKVTVFLIIGMFVMSGLVSANFLDQKETTKIETKKVYFTDNPTIYQKEKYFSINMPGTNSALNEPGNPHLPIRREVIEFSEETKIYHVSIDHSDVNIKSLHGKIIPSIKPLPMRNTIAEDPSSRYIENKEIYQSNDFYPNNWYDYTIKCGLDDNGKETTFVIVDIYPVRYQPATNKIHTISNAEININYKEQITQNKILTTDSYDLLIITPNKFVDAIQPLIDHKESIGIKTIVKTVEDILTEYEGRDQPEQIKYFIKDAKETMDINSVLLMGGLKSYFYAKDKEDCNHGSTNGWHIPVRYTNIKHSNEVGVISDLYYSDLYRYNDETAEWEFEDWDSNGDNIFADRGFGKQDELDLIPDLYVGRLACRTQFEVNTIINKIIEYESSPPDEKPWYHRMVGVAGKTFDLFDGIDQSQGNDNGFVTIIDNEWQEFVPQSDIFSRVELKVQSVDSEIESTLTVHLEKPLGTTIASSHLTNNELPSDDSDWVSFDFQDVFVDPGETYYITVYADVPEQFQWCYSEPILPGLSRYKPGNSSLGAEFDWCFKTFDLNENESQPDGEYSVDTAFRYMEPIIEEEIRVYWSNEGTDEPVPESQDIINAFNQGAGYVNMEGHGNPLSWATHPIPPGSPFKGGLSITDFPELKNKNKLPIVIVGGCHNALFNVSIIQTFLGRSHGNWYWTNGYITPICFCWALCASPVGGAIASTGCTGLGLGGSPPDLENSGGLDCNFFYKVGNGATSLGEAHSGAIQKYVLENKVVNDEMFCIVEFHLFGDPSLQLGGNS